MRCSRRVFLATVMGAAGSSCVRGASSRVAAHVWGGPGKRLGEFRRPRAIGCLEGEVYVIDKAGRVQVFDEEGAFLRHWNMPSAENGTPTCVSFSNKGTVLIPDTHYSVVREYTTDGEEVRSFGEYGSGPDQFIYPTGIVESADGEFFISEYGQEAERIHVFNNDGTFSRMWGSFGEDEGQLNRAMDILIDTNGDLVVVDSGNHRLQRFAMDGSAKGIIGAVGDGPGEFSDPFDAALTPDGLIIACDFGNCRLTAFDMAGQFVTTVGSFGRDPGAFAGPRGVTVSESGYVFVADTDNDRIQRIALEDVA